MQPLTTSHAQAVLKNDPRPAERIRHHYEVEKELARRLLNSSRAERTRLFASLYNELFARVPDHPRLARRDAAEASREGVAARMALLRGQLDGVKTFLEFAPGDCRLAFEVSRHVGQVIGVDISDQTNPNDRKPDNFKLVIYDGYQLDLPAESVDLMFSYQFIEHLHPEDVEPHFEMVKRLLKPGGAYVFSTPHAFSGPHDVSAVFSETPVCFHFKEWTYLEMGILLKRMGFSKWHVYRRGRLRTDWFANRINALAERLLGCLPFRLRNRLSQRLFLSVALRVQK